MPTSKFKKYLNFYEFEDFTSWIFIEFQTSPLPFLLFISLKFNLEELW